MKHKKTALIFAMLIGVFTYAFCQDCTSTGFDDLPTGYIVTVLPNDISVTVIADVDTACIFDTENAPPYDLDLQTPGYGPNNDTPLGKVLIISAGGLQPNDNGNGGTMIFDFPYIASVEPLTFIDIEEPSVCSLYNGGNLVSVNQIPQLGDNSVTQITLTGQGDQLVCTFGGSGAIDDFEICQDEILSIRLDSFTVTGREPYHLVSWSGAFDRATLQRSQDGRKWFEVTKDAHNRISGLAVPPFPDRNYYRLMMYEGFNMVYSKIIQLKGYGYEEGPTRYFNQLGQEFKHLQIGVNVVVKENCPAYLKMVIE